MQISISYLIIFLIEVLLVLRKIHIKPMSKIGDVMTKFEELANESYEEYKRGECTELTEEDFDQFLTPEAIKSVKEEVERRFKNDNFEKEQKVS